MMKADIPPQEPLGLARISVFVPILLLLYLVSGCVRSENAQPASQVNTQIPGTPIVTSAQPTSTYIVDSFSATKIAAIYEEEAGRSARATSWAQSTPYIVTPIIIPTAEPVMTPRLGITGDCAQGNSLFDIGGCWSGLVSDGYLFVDTIVRKTDREQGFLEVYTATLDLRTHEDLQRYPTPLRVGLIRPLQVTWPLMTVGTVDRDPQVTFVFDLANRQWVPGEGSPTPFQSALPSISPSAAPPLPSVSPLPTMSP